VNRNNRNFRSNRNEETMAAIREPRPVSTAARQDDDEPAESVPYVWIEPASEMAAVAILTAVVDTEIGVRDTATTVEDWASETRLV
jgi:hypothetical protein